METKTHATAGEDGDGSATKFLDRLLRATNAHDIGAITDCFASDYRNETPAHPSRGFQGRDQVRRNWEQILAHVPDLVVTAPRWAVDGGVLWTELEMRGTRRDSAPHLMRGVVVFGVRAGHAAWARFYLEPVTEISEDVNEAVRRQVAPSRSEAP